MSDVEDLDHGLRDREVKTKRKKQKKKHLESTDNGYNRTNAESKIGKLDKIKASSTPGEKRGKLEAQVQGEDDFLENLQDTDSPRKSKKKKGKKDYKSMEQDNHVGNYNLADESENLQMAAKKKRKKVIKGQPTDCTLMDTSSYEGETSTFQPSELKDLSDLKKKGKKRKYEAVSQEAAGSHEEYKISDIPKNRKGKNMEISNMEDKSKTLEITEKKKKLIDEKQMSDLEQSKHFSPGDPDLCGLCDREVKTKRKKKRKKHSESTDNGYDRTEAESKIGKKDKIKATSTPETKKGKLKSQDQGEDDYLENLQDTDSPRKSKKKKRKEDYKSIEQDNKTNEDNHVEENENLQMTAKRKRKKVVKGQLTGCTLMDTSSYEGETTAIKPSELKDLSDSKKKGKKRKFEALSQEAPEHGTSDIPKNRKGKNMETSNIKDKSKTSEITEKKKLIEKVNETQETSAHIEDNSAANDVGSKKKKKKKHSHQNLEGRDAFEGPSYQSTPREIQKKHQDWREESVELTNERHDHQKRLKLKKSRSVLECCTDLVNDVESGADGEGSPLTRKKSKKHRKSENVGDISLLDLGSVTEIPESQQTEVSTNTEREGREDTHEASSETTQIVAENDRGTDHLVEPTSSSNVTTPRTRKPRNPPRLPSIRPKDLKLLQEYFPEVLKRKNSTILHLLGDDLERIRVAKRKGIAFLTGRFTTKENEQIKKNVNTFMALTGVSSADKLFNSYKYPEEKRMLEQLKRKFQFRHRIAEGVPRALTEVFIRGTKIFDCTAKKGSYSEEEIARLKKEMAIHGNKWTVIGPLMGRNKVTLQLKASQLRREVTQGRWSIKETNRLITAVKEFVLKSYKEEPETLSKWELYKGIPWVQIEEKVQTRNWSQCKFKWTELLLRRMNNGVNILRGAEGVITKINIIKWLQEFGPEESGQIKWAELAEFIGNVPPLMLQNLFVSMKHTYIPEYKDMSFQEIVSRFYTDILPGLQEKLLQMESKSNWDSPTVTEKRDDYTVEEIFCEYISREHENNLYVK